MSTSKSWIWLPVFALITSCTSQDNVTTGPQTSPAVTPTTVGSAEGEPIPVIVDYSPTVSDVGGLMYLLSNPALEVLAISLPVTGEAGCDLGLEVTFGVLAMFGREEIPVACDQERPVWAGDWPAEFLAGHENLAFGLPDSDAIPASRSGPDLIAETVLASDRPVVLWAVAPLTNVARALDRHPQIGDQIERIVIMGGAVDVPGNTFDQAAEWNLWIDPPAAASVFSSGVPITMVPLDATNAVPVPVWYRGSLETAEQTAAIDRLSTYLRLFPAVTSGFFFMWDELAAAVVADPSLVSSETASVRVVEGGPDAGRTIRSPQGRELTLATGVPQPDLFYQEFLSTLGGSPVSIGPSATAEEQAYFEALNQALAETMSELNDAFVSGDIFGEIYDAEVATDAFDRVLTAQIEAIPLAEQLSPPDSMVELHQAYLSELHELAGIREDILAVAAGATSWEDFSSRLAGLWPDGPRACTELIEKAKVLGLEAQLPC
jgi:inosine-uridine nucleoside N-ribohydrolase